MGVHLWQKKGLLIVPQKQYVWMQTHAMLPTVDHLEKDRYMVYFSGRDKQNISHIGRVEVVLKNQQIQIVRYDSQPVLYPGDLGCFDDNGVTPSWIVTVGLKKYLYYIGWNKRSRVRMSLVMGLAISTDNGFHFHRYSQAPLFDRTTQEPYSILTAPCVLKENHLWRMWYVSGIGWINEDLPRYHIKYAESSNGIQWKRNGSICIDLNSKETALARPCVVKGDHGYEMWYAYKGKSYKIGYATSSDGLHWIRMDQEVGIALDRSGWDSRMMEYAFIFSHQSTKYMLYNGNDYGKNGIGYAVMDSE